MTNQKTELPMIYGSRPYVKQSPFYKKWYIVSSLGTDPKYILRGHKQWRDNFLASVGYWPTESEAMAYAISLATPPSTPEYDEYDQSED